MCVCVYGKGLNRSSGDGTERREGEGREGSGEVRIHFTHLQNMIQFTCTVPSAGKLKKTREVCRMGTRE